MWFDARAKLAEITWNIPGAYMATATPPRLCRNCRECRKPLGKK